MEEIETYIGNIESGKSGSIDILTNAVATTAASGDMSKVIVTYEDKEGNETTIEGNFKATVESPVYDNVEKIKDSTKSSDKKVLYGVIVVVIVIALFCICAIRKHKINVILLTTKKYTTMNIRPLADRVLIKPAAAEEKTLGGIIIPDSAKEKPLKGEVVAVGNGTKDEEMVVKNGDTVLYGKYAGTEIELDGEKYLIMRQSDILAII